MIGYNLTGTQTKFGSWDIRDEDTFKTRLLALVEACNVHVYCGAGTSERLQDYLMECIMIYGYNKNREWKGQ